ncbi:hypothetical protein ASF92_05405 [Pedobacter sp. Leaf176]|nr:hypothetical protein ASF92_05405 [Pedobacter sp. Leaf176]
MVSKNIIAYQTTPQIAVANKAFKYFLFRPYTHKRITTRDKIKIAPITVKKKGCKRLIFKIIQKYESKVYEHITFLLALNLVCDAVCYYLENKCCLESTEVFLIGVKIYENYRVEHIFNSAN